MLADSAALTAGGITAALFATAMGGLVAILTKRSEAKAQSARDELESKWKIHQADLDARLKGHDAEFTTVEFGQSVIKDAISWSEQRNKELRADLTAAEERIDRLTAAEAECRKSLALLTIEIERIKGGG